MTKNKKRPTCCCKPVQCCFVKVVEKLPECLCNEIPSIQTGPECPFNSEELLNLSQNGYKCPLSKGANAENLEGCILAQDNCINFKLMPHHRCDCVPGTCPEIAKNVIRSLGFDPKCVCPCPKAEKTQAAESDRKGKKRGKTKKSTSAANVLGLNDRATSKASNTDPVVPEGQSTPDAGQPPQSPTNIIPGQPPQTPTNITPGQPPQSPTNIIPGQPPQSPTNITPGQPPQTPTNTTPGQPPQTSTNFTPNQPLANTSNPPDDTISQVVQAGNLLVNGDGFKIYQVGNRRVLLNFSTHNCKYIHCSCSEKVDSCGCDEWRRMTKYRNCCCPGARKPLQRKPKLVQQEIKT